MKLITILQKSNLLVVLQHALGELSVTPCPDALMFIRLCVLLARQILRCRWIRHWKESCPQRKIVTGAASGYSSYGNQIGLATGLVNEIYHPNYVAKRMEIGAVMGAAPRCNVIRENSDPGDIIILLGGRTGRDGCGGATGSSKAHNVKSIDTCGAEVQKGNAPTERKLQRLFRNPKVSRLIKKCNDFGAGGVSVAIGELQMV